MSNPDFAGVKYINGYDDPEIVAGAGTIGIEVLEQISKVRVLPPSLPPSSQISFACMTLLYSNAKP